MLSGLLSIFLLGSPMSYLDFEVKTDEELEALEYNIYGYNRDLHINYNQNEAELYYLENKNVGTFDNPGNPEERMIHVFSQTRDKENIDTLIEIYFSHVLTSSDSRQLVERLDGYSNPSEGNEWRVFEIRVQNIESTDPNVSMWLSQEDFSVIVDEDAEITHDAIMFDEAQDAYQLYERNTLTRYYAKQVPIDEPFYIKYQHPNSTESYVIYIDDISKYETEE